MFSTGEAQETAKNDLIGYLKVLEGELGDRPYFWGETFGIVDVALVPSYSFFFAYEQCGNFNIVAECPALVAWDQIAVMKRHNLCIALTNGMSRPVDILGFLPQSMWKIPSLDSLYVLE
ncbi:probable glutathione S-transferase parC [Camellia sinensis]|uniref:probable glutathione S-transferase parC n=1 Tax=Camellia sinensis TaxID=4442 RepID=UPI001035A685|nr:probable glutathione S-transferase parC [Camellia sinensis]